MLSPGRILVAALLALLVPLCIASAAIAASPSMEPCQSMESGKAGSVAHVTLWNLLAGLAGVDRPQIGPPEAGDYLPPRELSPSISDRPLTPCSARAPPLA